MESSRGALCHTHSRSVGDGNKQTVVSLSQWPNAQAYVNAAAHPWAGTRACHCVKCWIRGCLQAPKTAIRSYYPTTCWYVTFLQAAWQSGIIPHLLDLFPFSECHFLTSYQGLLWLLLPHIRITKILTLWQVWWRSKAGDLCVWQMGQNNISSCVEFEGWQPSDLVAHTWYLDTHGHNERHCTVPVFSLAVSSAWVMWTRHSGIRALYQKKSLGSLIMPASHTRCQAACLWHIWKHWRLGQSIYINLWQVEVLR